MKSMLLDDQLNVDLRMRCQAQLPHRKTVLTRTSGLGAADGRLPGRPPGTRAIQGMPASRRLSPGQPDRHGERHRVIVNIAERSRPGRWDYTAPALGERAHRGRW